MEIKSTLSSLFLLFLILLSRPLSSKGGSVVVMDEDVYEIDYKGPETHSSIPPPDHSRGKPMIHHGTTMESPKCKGLRGCNGAANGKKIHG